MPAGSVEVDQVGVGEDVRIGRQRAHDELEDDQNPERGAAGWTSRIAGLTQRAAQSGHGRLRDPDGVARRVAERAVARAPGLVHGLLEDLGA